MDREYAFRSKESSQAQKHKNSKAHPSNSNPIKAREKTYGAMSTLCSTGRTVKTPSWSILGAQDASPRCSDADPKFGPRQLIRLIDTQQT